MGDVIYFRPPRFMDVEEFIDEGFMQEANRRFFHILGLELVAELQDDGSHLLRIWDSRDCEGGVVYEADDEEWSQVMQERARNVDRLWTNSTKTRSEKFGFLIQPKDEF